MTVVPADRFGLSKQTTPISKAHRPPVTPARVFDERFL